MEKLTFTGHETFHCRHFWLKKGYDFFARPAVSSPEKPSMEESILGLGVGKNMVKAINFWMRSFGLKDSENELTDLARLIFTDEQGFDPYLEDIGTLWLLQYNLIRTKIATTFHLVFKDFRKTRIDSQFTIQQLLIYLMKEAKQYGSNVQEKTFRSDIKVFIRSYFLGESNRKDLEDDLSSLLIDLNLLDRIENADLEDGQYFKINVSERPELPFHIFLYAIIDSFPEEVSISFDQIQNEVGDCFACNSEGVERKIQEICEAYGAFTYKEDAGRKELQIKKMPERRDVLSDYYNG